MPVPDVIITVRDGGLGIQAGSAAGIACKVGTCQLGNVNQVYAFNDAKTALDTLGQGPLTEAVARSLDVAGGPVIAVPVNGSVAGACGSVTHTGTGTATLVGSGAAYDAYKLRVTIVKGGASLVAATATFKYSLDGGLNYSPELAVPTGGVYVIPGTNVTLTWSYTSGTGFVALDTYSFDCTAPGFTLSDATAAINAARASVFRFGFFHIVGPAASAATAAAMAAGVQALLDAAATADFRYLWAAIEVPQDTDANLIAAFALTATTRVMWCAGFATVTSSLNGRQLIRSSAWPITERAALVRPGVDLARVLDGAVPGVVSVSRDERATPGLDDARFATLRTIVGYAGFFINNGRMGAQLGSDFSLVQYRRVMDVFCDIIHTTLVTFLNDSVTVDSNGHITDQSAARIETYVDEQCRNQLTRPGDATDLSIKVNQNVNIISTGTTPVTGRIIPLGYSKSITADLGFQNPALILRAA